MIYNPPSDYERPVTFKKFPDTWLAGYFCTWSQGSVHPVAVVELESGEVCSTLQIYNKEMYFLDKADKPLERFLWWVLSSFGGRREFYRFHYY